MDNYSRPNPRKSPAMIFADAEHLVEKGDATLHYLEHYLKVDTEISAELYREAGLGLYSHRMNGDDLGYRDQLDIETVGNVLSLQDKIKDRGERLQLICDAINAFEDRNWLSHIDEVIAYIRKERPSQITMEHAPEFFRTTVETMTQDLITLLLLKDFATTLGTEDIIRFFGVEANTFHENFELIFAGACKELDVEVEVAAIPVVEDGFARGVSYTFRLA